MRWQVQLCAVSDLVGAATVHVRVLHAGAAGWHAVQMRALSSLWLLFRGQKRNALRRRVDSCDYRLDQVHPRPAPARGTRSDAGTGPRQQAVSRRSLRAGRAS